MSVEKRLYEKNKKKLLNDKKICSDNRKYYDEFLLWEENKLTYSNDGVLDEANYKTLNGYLHRIVNINSWFENKPLKDIDIDDMKRVHHNLETGVLKNRYGTPFRDKKSYYNKMFKAEFFRKLGKEKIVRDVLCFPIKSNNDVVHFITGDDFKKIESVVSNPNYKLLLWLAWDYGENIGALLQLKKSDFTLELGEDKEHNYRLNYRREILKRSRMVRADINMYNDTYHLLKSYLSDLDDDEFLFKFKRGASEKFLRNAVEKVGVKCSPSGKKVTWKDFRSGMTCHFYSVYNWSITDLNGRLGHKPSSSEIDKYINYFAKNKSHLKAKVKAFKTEELENKFEILEQQNKKYKEKLNELEKQRKKDLDSLKNSMGVRMFIMLFEDDLKNYFFENNFDKKKTIEYFSVLLKKRNIHYNSTEENDEFLNGLFDEWER